MKMERLTKELNIVLEFLSKEIFTNKKVLKDCRFHSLESCNSNKPMWLQQWLLQ